MIKKPAFIVDGFTEKNIIDRICPNKPIRRTDLNGKNVTLDAIAIKVASIIRLLNNKYYPIILIIDKENRSETCEEISNYLEVKFKSLGFQNEDIRINIADKMIENWIIADWNILNCSHKKPENTDGINGAFIIKQHYKTYNKATDCLKLLNSFNPALAYKNSPSFKNFIDNINDIECYFSNFEK